MKFALYIVLQDMLQAQLAERISSNSIKSLQNLLMDCSYTVRVMRGSSTVVIYLADML